jgi:hypothetical protein
VPSVAELEAMAALLRPWELVTDPVFHGMELLRRIARGVLPV